jgi:hypothetical protein
MHERIRAARRAPVVTQAASFALCVGEPEAPRCGAANLAIPVKHVIAPMVEHHVRPLSGRFGTSPQRITKSRRPLLHPTRQWTRVAVDSQGVDVAPAGLIADALAGIFDRYRDSDSSQLVHQPEATIIFERLEADPHTLRAAWEDRLPTDELDILEAIWGG